MPISYKDPIFNLLRDTLVGDYNANLSDVNTFLMNVVELIKKSTLLVDQITALDSLGPNIKWNIGFSEGSGSAGTTIKGREVFINIDPVNSATLKNPVTAAAFVSKLAYELGHAQDPELNQITYSNSNGLAIGANTALALIGEGKSVFNELQADRSIGLSLADIPQDVKNESDPTRAILLGAGDASTGTNTLTGNQGLAGYWKTNYDAFFNNLDAKNEFADQNVYLALKSMSSMKNATATFSQDIANGTTTITINNITGADPNINGVMTTISSYSDTFGGYGPIVASGTTGGQGNQKSKSAAPTGVLASQTFNFGPNGSGGSMVDTYNPISISPTISIPLYLLSQTVSELVQYWTGANGTGINTSDTVVFSGGISLDVDLTSLPSGVSGLLTAYSGPVSNNDTLRIAIADTNGSQVTFDQGTASGATGGSGSSTVSVNLNTPDNLVGPDGLALPAQFTFNPSSGAASMTLLTNSPPLVLNLAGITGSTTLSPIAGASPIAQLTNYLSELGYTGPSLVDTNFNALNPAGSPYDVTGVITPADDQQSATVTFSPTGGPGAQIAGQDTAIITVDGQDEIVPVTANYLEASGNLAQDSIDNIQQLDTGGNNVTLTSEQFNGFTGANLDGFDPTSPVVYGITGGGIITAANDNEENFGMFLRRAA